LAIYRGAGGAGDAVGDASSEVLLALQAKDAAIAAEVAAETAQAAAQTSATNAATSATNASNSASTASTQASNAASSASAASTSASNASTSATNASNSASAASTSATNASNSASAASTSATNASNSASAASTSASNASTSASNAATSATNAANAQTAAETARDQTLTAYDNFDDRYLGSKTSDPTLDNDGNALVAGSLYFNSVSGAMKVYTGSAWVDAYSSGTTFLTKANNLSDLVSASTARTNLGLGTIATQAASSVSITGGSITGITDLAVADGGTGASTAANARTNLGLVIGTDVLSPSGSGASLTSLNATNISSGTLAAARLPAFSGDATSTIGTSALTLATVNSNTGSFGSSTAVPVITVNGKGLITAVTTAAVSGSISVTGGDLTMSGNTGTAITNATLATVNSNTGSFGSSTAVPVITVNGKGLITAISTSSVQGGAALSNDTSTASDLYPMFAAATSGTPTTVYTSNAKLLYKPSTGELKASQLVATNGIIANSATIAANYTIASGQNAMSTGAVTVNSGVTVTVSSGSRWVVL